uniref:Uncharacterized protein n=1 Tax=Fervidicoccus fontis TaxID=683846 RepID=A0A7J3ZK73_9CREN
MEPVFLKNCTKVVGLVRGRLTAIQVDSVLVDEDGKIYYNTTSKTGHVIDCKRGVIGQAAYNGFLTTVRKELSEPATLDAASREDGVTTGVNQIVLWHVLAGSTGISIEGDCKYIEDRTSSLKQMLGHIKLICLREPNAKEETAASVQGGSEHPSFMLISDHEMLRDEYTNILSRLAEKATRDTKSIVYVLTGIDRRLVIRFMNKRKTTPLSDLLPWLASNLPNATIVVVTHGWISARDLELIMEMDKVYLVHCPYTSMSAGYGGFFPLKEALARMSQRLAIGTCIPGSKTPFTSMIDFLVLEKLLVSYNYWSPSPAVEEIAFMLYNGWKIVDRLKSCIEPGCKSDLIVYKKTPTYNYFSSSVLSAFKHLTPSLIVSDRGLLEVESLLESLESPQGE